MPSPRDDPATTRYAINQQGTHLTEAKRCSEQADHFCEVIGCLSDKHGYRVMQSNYTRRGLRISLSRCRRRSKRPLDFGVPIAAKIAWQFLTNQKSR